MKLITKTSVAAIALMIATPALADCPNGADNHSVGVIPAFPFQNTGFTFPVNSPTAEVLTGESYADYDSDCFTPVGIGLGESTTGEIVDSGVPGVGIYETTPSLTVGPNNSAFGNGSAVFAEETYTHPGPDGLLGTADDQERTRIIPVSNGTAIGANSKVSHDNSTAVGAGAQSTDDHQVTLGTDEDTIRAPGLTSQESKDRQEGPVELVTSDSGGRLATDGGATHAAIESNAHAIAANSTAIQENAEGVAIAMAMPDAFLDSTENFSIAAGFGGFNGETAFGAIGTARIYGSFSAYAGGGVSTSGSQWGWKVGARAGF